MNHNNKITWLSIYIYTDSADELLVKNILPMILHLKKEKLAQKYFFIRYHDNTGFHIRLRLKGKKEDLDTSVLSLVKKIFPKSRVVSYRKELKRYGGKYGTEIAEDIFESSSKVILSFLKENQDVTYNAKLKFSLQLTVSMVHAFDMSKTEALYFFDHLANVDDITSFKSADNIEKTTISPFILNLWSSLDQNKTFDKAWFNSWIKELTDIKGIIQNAFSDKKINSVDPMKKHSLNPLWYLYESYIHMNNNRLGIYIIDEPYIAYLLKQAFVYE